MHRPPLAVSLLLTLLGPMCPLDANAQGLVIGHEIDARLDPDSGRIEVSDRLALPPGQSAWDLILHRGLSPTVTSGNAEIRSVQRQGHLERLRLSLTGPGPVTMTYGGVIRHDLDTIREGMGRERRRTTGTIGPDGIFLDGSGGWYPWVPDSLQRFDLRVALPPGWLAVSQGQGPGSAPDWTVTWSESQPQDDIYLIAAPFTLYRASDGSSGVQAQVWLRRSDPDLARRYLDATREYVALYSELIGPYPYAKFALVENFWETGYGMPSFTLLGPRVIRLPFIVRTSYPHEILHSWWGNGVYVDYAGGNWSEGLTAYLADHLMKERAGQGAEYRRDALKSYADYVREDEDFPLTAFRGRHGSASQAIGYGKSAMVFHMLRRTIGDDAFRLGLQRFYQDNRFKIAGWPQLRRAFESASGRELGTFFDAWTARTGAPRLALSEVRLEDRLGGYRLSGRIRQTQQGAPFPLLVPVLVDLADGTVRLQEVAMDQQTAEFSFDLETRPVRVALDPALDCFRELMPGESPVSLSNLFGSPNGTVILPSGADPELLAAYRGLAEAWTQDHPGWQVAMDNRLDSLPEQDAVWILGWNNRLAPAFAAQGSGFSLDLGADEVELAGQRHAREVTSPVLTAGDAEHPLAWLGASEVAAVPGLARKLPHYGKYGYLAFTGAAPDNTAKGQWPPGDSALVHWLVSDRPALAAWTRPPLVGTRKPE